MYYYTVFVFELQIATCPPQYQLITVQYSVEFPSDRCRPANGTNPPTSTPLNIAVPAGSTALDVLTRAVDISRRYQFQVTSFGATLGFSIRAIAGTASSTNTSCFWTFNVKEGNSPIARANVGVSSYSICSEDLSIIYQYSSFASHSGAASTAQLAVPLIMALITITLFSVTI